MKKLFFCMILVIISRINGMEGDQVVPQNNTEQEISQFHALELGRKIDALSGVVQAEAGLIKMVAKGLCALIQEYQTNNIVLDQHGASMDDHATMVSNQSNQIKLLIEALKPVSNYVQQKEERKSKQKSLNKAILDEVDACLDGVNDCQDMLDMVEENQFEIQKQNRLTEDTVLSLKDKIKELEERTKQLELVNSQEQSEEKDPKEKAD